MLSRDNASLSNGTDFMSLESKVAYKTGLGDHTRGVALGTYPGAVHGGLLTEDNQFISFVPEQTNRTYVLAASRMRDLYSSPEVSEYRKYLASKGMPVRETTGQAVVYDFRKPNSKRGPLAAHNVIEVDGRKGSIFLADLDFHRKHAADAQKYGVSPEANFLNSVLHETTHSVKTLKNAFFRAIYREFPYAAERFVEGNVYDFAIEKAAATEGKEREMWLEVAQISKLRYESVVETYKSAKKRRKKDREEEPDPEAENDLEQMVEESEGDPEEGMPAEEGAEGEGEAAE